MKRSVVTSGHREVSAAARLVLEAGGNAFDAAVAAGFAAAVCEPALTSLGGGGFLLGRSAAGDTTLFDFFVDTPGRGLEDSLREPHFVPITVRFPSSDQVFNVGRGSVAVPGTLAGLLHVHEARGRLDLEKVVAPAVALARGGVTVAGTQAYVLSLLEPVMTLEESGRHLYASNGRYVRAGDRVVQEELAEFIASLPTGGSKSLYEGETASAIERDMRAGGGLLTAADLAAYEVVEREPLEIAYRGGSLFTNPAPSFGGSLLAMSLALLEPSDVGAFGFGSARHLLLLAAVMREVDRWRESGFISLDALTPQMLADGRRVVRTSSGGTTHVSVCDRDGNVASMTTSNGENSGYFAPGTGVMLNNMLGEDDLHPDGFHSAPPGVRVSSMMSPSIFLAPDNRGVLALGSGGSKRIRTALMQVLSNVVDFSMSLEAAVEAPRIHWDGERLQVEPGYRLEAVEKLRDSLPVNEWQVRDVYFGGVNAVDTLAGAGAGDPRRGGAVAIVA